MPVTEYAGERRALYFTGTPSGRSADDVAAHAFRELRRATWEEWRPEGSIEIDCVETIILCLWRKQRVRAKRKLDMAVALDRVENRVFRERPPQVLLKNDLGWVGLFYRRQIGKRWPPVSCTLRLTRTKRRSVRPLLDVSPGRTFDDLIPSISGL